MKSNWNKMKLSDIAEFLSFIERRCMTWNMQY